MGHLVGFRVEGLVYLGCDLWGFCCLGDLPSGLRYRIIWPLGLGFRVQISVRRELEPCCVGTGTVFKWEFSPCCGWLSSFKP